MSTQQKCEKHEKQFNRICLAEDCKNYFLLCSQCDISVHKHSKTQIQEIKNIKDKLKSKWQVKQSTTDAYIKKSRIFYDSLRKEINKLIDEDQKTVENILNKIKYHHLPVQANSMAYIELMKSQYDRLDKHSILTLLSEAENSQLNKDMDKQKQIHNFMDLELKKIKDKVLTLKYVMLSKKLQTQMMIPHLSETSICASNDQFIKIYSLFNSRNMLIRSGKLIYRASENNFEPSSFENRCAGILNCLAVIKTVDNKIYGGFSPIALCNYPSEQELVEEYQNDITKKSFIFSINNLRSYSLKDSNRAVRYISKSVGPSFGVDLQVGKLLTSNIGHSYESPPGVQVDSIQASVFLLESDKVQIKDFQIWQISF